jgi:hydrogenase nickel incorporation protein HypA/HybF
MHEMSLMQAALDMAQEVAQAQNAKAIHRIWLTIGAESGIVPEAMAFAFEVMRANTLAAAAALELISAPGTDLQLASVEVEVP